MTLRKTTRVRLTEHQFLSLQKMALCLNTDISTVIRYAIDDAIETLNRWTFFDISIEDEKEPSNDKNT